jgi:hypothetical protein
MWPFGRPPPPPPPPPPTLLQQLQSLAQSPDAAALAIGLLLVLALAVAVKAVAVKAPSAGPKRSRSFVPTEVTTARADCTVDAFKQRKVPEDVDFVMIGSGIGSLYCAGLLARAGFKVVVLEQHYVAGGCTHSFEDHGYEFDTGLHYVGRIEKYKVLLDLVSAKGKEVEWAKMGTEADGFTYDKVVIGKEKPHLFRAGADKFVEDLAARFPADRDGIEAYSKCASKATHTLAHTLARAPRSERAIRAGDPRGPCQTIGVAGVCANVCRCAC